ncbi:CheR family methyltransferase [Pseudoduganella sp.]|uniref:CheR family methyltransferase n=1 Tax=Pseudoduganella sp. TaxID=1880898 RepID=UPI0035B27AEC
MTPPDGQETAAQGLASVDFPLVGIGASAGGLEALQSLLPGLPPAPGFSIVVIMHLAPGQASELGRVLQAHCSMPVLQLDQPRIALQPDHIYVITPGALLKVEGQFLLQSEASAGGGMGAIDYFFHSLAQAQRELATGILLSGAGRDGCGGLAALREQGGSAIVQAPQDAVFAALPQAAIDAGLADFVLPAGEMAARLCQVYGAAGAVHEAQSLQDVLALLHERTGHDFRQYKRPAILRRLEKRQGELGLASHGAYYTRLQQDAGEAAMLLKELLIGVTGFFRDREAFARLREAVLPALLAGRGGGAIRVWVAACSTGQEAYSLAILLSDLVGGVPNPPSIQVFASDIDEQALQVARAGLYPESIREEVPAASLERHFVHAGKQYRVRQSLRDLVTFASHDLLRDPPFTGLDLVTCRNFLIYLDRPLQHQVLKRLHFALAPHGYLFLGSAESADLAPGLFARADRQCRLYQALPAAASALAAAPAHWPPAAGGSGLSPMDDMRERLAEAELGWADMQSSNDQLSQRNAELTARLAHADKAHDDLFDLVASAELASVFVDPELRVRQFTPRAAGIFNLIARDVGRHLLDITNRLDYPKLAADVAQIFATLQPLEREVKASGGRHYIVRVRPYRNGEDAILGAVLTFFDFSERRLADELARAQASDQRFLLHLGDCLRPLTDPAQVLALGCGMLGRRLAVPQLSYAAIHAGRYDLQAGYAAGMAPLQGGGEVAGLGGEVLARWGAGEVLARTGAADAAAPGLAGMATLAGAPGAALSALCRSGQRWQGFFLACQPGAREWSAPEVALFEQAAARIGAAFERSRTQAALQASTSRMRGLLRGLARAYWETDGSGVLDDTLLAAVQPGDRAAIEQHWRSALRGGDEIEVEVSLHDADGACRPASLLVTPLRDAQGEILRWAGCIIDGAEQAPLPSGSI